MKKNDPYLTPGYRDPVELSMGLGCMKCRGKLTLSSLRKLLYCPRCRIVHGEPVVEKGPTDV